MNICKSKIKSGIETVKTYADVFDHKVVDDQRVATS